MKNSKDQLSKITSPKGSAWQKDFEFEKNNPWLRAYSSQIARRVLAAIRDSAELNQAKLAQKISIKPQQVSKIVKGKENLTLESIYKLSKALNIDLISFPEYKYSSKFSMNTTVTYPETSSISGESFIESTTNVKKTKLVVVKGGNWPGIEPVSNNQIDKLPWQKVK
jgi:transcriptional regulator with XRE-family HTH domain